MLADGFVILTMPFRQDGRRWTGECLELRTATYGRTLKQARALADSRRLDFLQTLVNDDLIREDDKCVGG